MHRESSSLPPWSMPRPNSVGCLSLFAIWGLGSLLWSAGCSVRGFQTIPDGPTTPSTLRAGAAVSRAEAQALDAIADQQEGVIRETLGALQATAEAAGLGPLAGVALGGAAGWLVPTPGQRRRERVAASEAKAGSA